MLVISKPLCSLHHNQREDIGWVEEHRSQLIKCPECGKWIVPWLFFNKPTGEGSKEDPHA